MKKPPDRGECGSIDLATDVVVLVARVSSFQELTCLFRVNTAAANVTGNCHQTNDSSRFCYMRNADGTYALSILDNDDSSYPQVMSVNCKTGDYRGWGVLNDDQLRVWASVFCKQL